MKASIEILAMQKLDLESVLLIEKECNLSPWSREDYLSEVDRSDSITLVAVSNERVAGFLIMRLIKIVNEADLLNIGVLKNYRERGVGALLLKDALNKCMAENISKIWLEVRDSNSAAAVFYEKLGFRRISVRKNFYQHPTEDAATMRLDIENI